MVRIHRSKLLNAPYNPRKIDDRAKSKLKTNLEKIGLIQPVTWNLTTGNIVSGHKRMELIDAIEGTPDYELDVAQVELDEKQEKAQNIFMNNPEAQGQFDIPELEKMFAVENVDAVAAGFEIADLYHLFGTAPGIQDAKAMEQFSDKIKAAQDQMDSVSGVTNVRNESEFYFAAVFANDAECNEAIKILGLQENRYVDGRYLLNLLRKAIPDAKGEEQERKPK